MKLLIERDRLLNLLIAVTSVVERRQTLPILANAVSYTHLTLPTKA